MAELLVTDDALVRECVFVDTPVSLQVSIISKVRSALVTLKWLLTGVDASMRMHTLQVIEGGSTQITQVGARLEAAT